MDLALKGLRIQISIISKVLTKILFYGVDLLEASKKDVLFLIVIFKINKGLTFTNRP